MTIATSGAPTGIVIRTEGSRADVSTTRRGACATCAEASACFVPDIESCQETVSVRNLIGAQPGDTVELGLPANAVLRLSALVWVVPLAGLLLGAVAGAVLGAQLSASGASSAGAGSATSDLLALFGALVGTGAAFAVLRRIDRRAAGDPRVTPRIARVVERGGAR